MSTNVTNIASELKEAKAQNVWTDGLVALIFLVPLSVAAGWPLGFAWRLFRAGAGW